MKAPPSLFDSSGGVSKDPLRNQACAANNRVYGVAGPAYWDDTTIPAHRSSLVGHSRASGTRMGMVVIQGNSLDMTYSQRESPSANQEQQYILSTLYQLER